MGLAACDETAVNLSSRSVLVTGAQPGHLRLRMVLGLEIHMQVCEAEIRVDQQLRAIFIPHMLCMTCCFAAGAVRIASAARPTIGP
jgi:hypothetical protein